MLLPRIQVVVSYEQRSGLRRMARRHGVSTSELVRSAIDQMLVQDRTEDETSYDDDPFLALEPVAGSGPSDISIKHDDYLIEDELRKWHRTT